MPEQAFAADDFASARLQEALNKIKGSISGDEITTKVQISILAVFVNIVAFAGGIILFIIALLRFKKNAENPNNYPIGNTIAILFSAVGLISLSTFYQMVSNTLGSDLVGSSSSILAVNSHIAGFDGKNVAVGGFSKFIPTDTGQTILAFVFLTGMISFVRGIFLLKDIGSPQGQQRGIGQPITHILGGAVAMNILQFSCILGRFVGSEMMCLAG